MGTTLWDLEDYLLRIYAVRHNLADLTTDWLGIRMGVFRPQINPPDYQMEKTNPPDYQIEQKNPPDYQMEQASPSCSPDYLPQIPPFSKLH